MEKILFDNYGVKIQRINNDLYLIYDDGELVEHVRKVVINKEDMKEIVKSEECAYKFIINFQNKEMKKNQ